MPRRKLKQTKAAIAARRRYRAKKAGAGRSVGAGIARRVFRARYRPQGTNPYKKTKVRAKKIGAGRKVGAGILGKVSLKQIMAAFKNKSNFVKRKFKKPKKVGGFLGNPKIGRVPKCRTCSHRRRR